ncbi:hypothetical protein [Bartonella sp. CB175]|uniref:hypothetical protein n=1 Tax=Bartonella sp. CB175 TaxID=3112256 RepID=UPI00300E38A4
MINFNSGYKDNLKYWIAYLIGFIAILAIIVTGGFYMVRPHLDSFVKKEMKRHSIKAETSGVSILGKVNLTNVTVPVSSGVSLKIGAISARPPISFIPGTFTLYNVDLKYNNTHVQIPKISLGGVSLKKKDPTITFKPLQSVMRVELSSVVAPNILLSMANGNKQTEKIEIKNFQLYNFKNGRINSVSLQKMDLEKDVNGLTPMHLIAKSKAIEARDIDILYAYSVIFGKNKVTNKGKVVMGAISLDDTMVNIFAGTEKNASFSTGKFKISNLAIKSPEKTYGELFQAYHNAKKGNNQAAPKALLRALAINNWLFHITSVDAQINKASIDIPQLKVTFESFRFKPGQWEQWIPQKLLFSIKNLLVQPKRMKEKDLNIFSAMYSEPLAFSENLDFSYNEKERTLFLNGLSNVEDLFSEEMSVKIINVDPRLFSALHLQGEMGSALRNIGVTEMMIRYTDSGFIDKIFSHAAQYLNDNKRDLKEELYQNLDLIMTQSPKILLKNHDKAEMISKSLGDFAKKLRTKGAHTLTIKMMAQDKEGITMADFDNAMRSDPLSIIRKLSLTINNETSTFTLKSDDLI